MKMPNGGYQPAYNFQFATDCKSQVVVGVDVSQQGTDGGLLLPMLENVIGLSGCTPKQWLADGGFKNKDDVVAADNLGCEIYMPPQKNKEGEYVDPHRKDPQAVKELNSRMRTEEAAEIYKDRSTYAELTNAHARNHGFKKLVLQKLEKVKSLAFLAAAYVNMNRMKVLNIL